VLFLASALAMGLATELVAVPALVLALTRRTT